MSHQNTTSPKVDASMELLNSILRETIDPEYEEYIQDHPKDFLAKKYSWRSVIIGIMTGILITSYALIASSAVGYNVDERYELIKRIEQAVATNNDLNAQLVQHQKEISNLEKRQAGNNEAAIAVQVWSATQQVHGTGIAITVHDNPNNPHGLIVDQDIRQIVNGLWASGAEAIAVNGHRLSNMSAIRQAGGAVTVDYRSISSPYVIEAIGDNNQMLTTFSRSQGGMWLLYLEQKYQVVSTIDQRSELTLAADVSVNMGHAHRIQ